MIARVRDEENRLPGSERLFVDPYAHLFLEGAEAETVGEMFLSVPFFREQVRLRTVFIDDFVREGLSAGARQIVILGAGFDSRAIRLPEISESGAHVFEVDFAAQLERKRTVLDRAGVAVPAFIASVPCDFTSPSWEASLLEDLRSYGFDTGHRALFLLEGVISYLDAAEIRRTLGWMASTASHGSASVFNFTVARLDPADVKRIASDAGFSEIEVFSGNDLHRRYIPGEPPPGGELFHFATAR